MHRALFTMKHITSIIESHVKKYELLGAGLKFEAIPQDEKVEETLSILCTSQGVDLFTINVHLRAKIKSITYTSRNYQRGIKTCSHYLVYRNSVSSSDKYVSVLFYFELLDKKYFIGNEIVTNGFKFKTKYGDPVRHLKKVS